MTRQSIEDVHQVRVACRRLRAGLAFFGDCFDDATTDRWRRQLKKILKRFGPARDCDVHIEFLRGVLSELKAQETEPLDSSSADDVLQARLIRPGIARLLLRLEQRRDALQPGVVKAVRRFGRNPLTTSLYLEADRLLYDVDPADGQDARICFYDRAAGCVDDRLARVLALRSSLDDPSDEAGHHALRIAVKKLRYTLELCDGGMEGRLRKTIKRLKTLQTLLGELHDCDVWDAQIEAFVAEETDRVQAYFGHTRPMRRLLTGLRYLQSQQRQRRTRQFDAAGAYMADLDAADYWNGLVRAIRETPAMTDGNDEDGRTDDGS